MRYFLSLLILALSLTAACAQEEEKPESQTEEASWGNKGFLYSNPYVGEQSVTNRPSRTLPPPPPPIPPKPVPTQLLPKKPEAQKPETKTTPIITPEASQPAAAEEKTAYAQEEIASLKAKLEAASAKLTLANQKIKELQAKAAEKKITQTYMVKKGDCLWKIAAKKEIYGDPYKWLLLYHANRDQIYDPRLIFPNTVLIIPRIDEYEKPR
jgi:nucleoid-associated protein YgaU